MLLPFAAAGRSEFTGSPRPVWKSSQSTGKSQRLYGRIFPASASGEKHPMKWKTESPPRSAEFLLRILLPEREKHDLLGDYEEYYKEIFDSKGWFIANLWYWMQILMLIPKSIWNSTNWSLIMIRNYMKITFRNLKKHSVY